VSSAGGVGLQGLLRAAFARPDQPAIVDPAGARTTYAQLLERAAGFAAALQSAGPPGSRVAVALEPGLDAVVSLLGAWLARWTAVPLNPQIRPAELEFVLRDSGAARLVRGDELLTPLDARIPPAGSGARLGDVSRRSPSTRRPPS
jgi:acyl-CoA synthetase (AMP-forming)/AMP-acid ligase II